MKPIDPNRWALLVAVIILACLTVNSRYRLEITNTGLKLEKGQAVLAEQADKSTFSPPTPGQASRR
ncbi:hypothetical protein ABIB99_008694 [Bradyrhizobium sp. LA6.1]|uniref:hypothetical protein n=1 Tax=Bradyrhizobium sp. LA6.1 TaxID=3156378 RepID=UPI003393ACA1